MYFNIAVIGESNGLGLLYFAVLIGKFTITHVRTSFNYVGDLHELQENTLDTNLNLFEM